MIPEIRNHSYQQRLKDLELICLVQRRLWEQLIDVFKYLNRFNNFSPIGLFDYDFNDRTRNNGKQLIVKAIQYISSALFFSHQHCNNLECPTLVNIRTVNTFKNHLDAHWEDNPPDVQVMFPNGWCSQPNMDSGGPCMAESKQAHHLGIQNCTQYSDLLHHTVTGTALTWQRGWLSWTSPCWTGPIITKHTNTKEKLKV